MNGPQHYLEAEALLATVAGDAATAERAPTAEIAGVYRRSAELALKAAHVHAMLAVAAATYDAPRNAPVNSQAVVDPDTWAEALA